MVIEYNRMVIEYNRITIGSRIDRINRIKQEKDVKIRLPKTIEKQSNDWHSIEFDEFEHQSMFHCVRLTSPGPK